MNDNRRLPQYETRKDQASLEEISRVRDSIASQSGRVTNEELVLAAMFGKSVQNDINGIKGNAVGDSLKVTNVDMSKVMPSHILKTMRIPSTPQQESGITRQATPQIPPAQINHTILDAPSTVALPLSLSTPDDGQTEFDFDKKARYQDIIEKLDQLESKIGSILKKVEAIESTLAVADIEIANKKKPVKTSFINAI